LSIRQITIIGTGLIGGSVGLAFRKRGFRGKIVGCDRAEVLVHAKRLRAIHEGNSDPVAAVRGSDLVILATPVGGIIELIRRLGPHLSRNALLTDVGSTKVAIAAQARTVFGKENAGSRFLPGHPIAGKENSGIEHADAALFEKAVWFVTPSAENELASKSIREYLRWIGRIGAKVAVLEAEEHDQLCAWISHIPQMLATALAGALVEEYGERAPVLESGGRALREMTRIASSPYSMWRDIAITNKKQISRALSKLEQRLAHIRENLDTRELELEFENAHRLAQQSPGRHGARRNQR